MLLLLLLLLLVDDRWWWTWLAHVASNFFGLVMDAELRVLAQRRGNEVGVLPRATTQ
jgi:hypothetical protein